MKMMKSLAFVTVASAALCLSGDLFAHGGTYRGPGDTVPPNSGSGSGKTGNPGTPSTPTPGTPSTPTPGTPSTPTSGGPATPSTAPPTGGGARNTPTSGARGFTLSSDLTKWEFWWEFNKDPFLNLRAKIQAGGVTSGSDDFQIGRGKKNNATNTLAPNKSDRKRIIDVLKKLLIDPDSNRDIVSSCMMALAKIGGDTSVLPLFKKFLPDADQEKRETAGIAMGVTALKEAVPDLLALAADNQEGQALVGKSRVDFRTRSFACYALGLVANQSSDTELQGKILEAMKEVASLGRSERRDTKVAALNAIRLLKLDSSQRGQELRADAIEFLTAFMNKSRKEETGLVRSHAVTALAAIVGRTGDEKGDIRKMFLKLIDTRKTDLYVQQSAVLGLGLMGIPGDEQGTSKSLQRYSSKGKDQQARYYACVALGKIGGSDNKEYLYKTFKASRTQKIQMPWLAFGLAIIEDNARNADTNYDADRTVAEALHKTFLKMKTRSVAAGIALALGIMRYKDAADDIEAMLENIQNDEEPAGYLCVALGLMNNRDSKDLINSIVEKSVRRQKILTQGSIALGLLGDKEISNKLIKMLERKNTPVAVYSAVASALGWIGDRRSITPLIEMAENKDLQNLPRAFSAVALGLIADKEPLPWNSKIAIGANYRANVESLTGGGGTGILDIL